MFNCHYTLMRNMFVVVLVVGIAGANANAAPISIDFNASGETVKSGEPSNSVGLMLPGQVGTWNELAIGSINSTGTNVVSVNTGSGTFTLNPTGTDKWRRSGGFSTDDLRGDAIQLFPFHFNSAVITGFTVDWELTGLTPNASYDMIFFGTVGNREDPFFSIDGHDAGNGVGNPVDEDTERDGNFTDVLADGTGKISGTFAYGGTSTAVGAASNWAGLQFQEQLVPTVPEPSTLVLICFGLIGFTMSRRRRNRV